MSPSEYARALVWGEKPPERPEKPSRLRVVVRVEAIAPEPPKAVAAEPVAPKRARVAPIIWRKGPRITAPVEQPQFWGRETTLTLATTGCNLCLGMGICLGRHGAERPCNCVLRTVFRACFNRYREIATREKYMSRVTLDPLPGKDRKGMWGRKDEEYAADFVLTARRVLGGDNDSLEWRIFRYHFLLGTDWKFCCTRLAMDRGNFFHAVYRIEQKLGRAFRELRPYALFPVSDYFHGPVLGGVTSCLQVASGLACDRRA